MRSTPAEFNETKNLKVNKPIHLFTLYDYNGAGSHLYYAEYTADVSFGGQIYTSFPITFDIVSENKSGGIDKVQVTVGNVSRLIGAYLEDYDFRGKKVSIKTVWADQLNDPDNYIEDIFYIDDYTADENSVVFTLASKFDVLDIGLPLRKYARNYCTWKFKSDECGYDGTETTCNKTKDACKARNNYQRFGGFPSVSSTRVMIG